MKKVYLDMNIYNRPFDDQSQTRIKLETIAVFAIFQMIKTGKLKLVWSFILDYENSLNPYDDIRLEIGNIAFLASEHIMASELIRTMAKIYESKGLKPRDALHLACAVKSGSEYLITCDDRIIKKYPSLGLSVKIMNPIQFILETEEKGYGTYE
jgi:hypothetical protein